MAILYLIFALLITSILTGECDMTAIVTFQDCVFFCVNKYGTNPDTQRKFYNRLTGTCQKAAICTTTPFRVYENRCLDPFESFSVGDQQVSLPEIYEQIIVVMVHGNFNAIREEDMCYPGFFSSRKKIQIGVQVYQQYFCDLPIGSDPETYPTTHGEYFFYKLTASDQFAAVDLDCPPEPSFDVGFAFLLAAEVLFFLVIIHYHCGRCWRKVKRSFKKEEKQNE